MFRLIECLHYSPNSILIEWVLRIVAIDKCHAHLSHLLFLHPILDEVLNLRIIHKLHIIHMPIFLPLQGHIFRQASIAKPLGIRLMLITVSIELQSNVARRLAIGTLSCLRVIVRTVF